MAFRAKAAFLKGTGGVRAETGKRTAATIGAVIKRAPEAASILENEMITDFFGNGSAVTAQTSSDFFKGSRSIKHRFDSAAFIER